MNENYCVRVGAEEFVLRIYGRKAEPETRLERHMLRTLAADGFPCPHPIVGDGDTDVFLVSGRPAIAYPMLPGTQKKRGTPAILEELGHLQGRIHRTFRHDRIRTDKPGWDPEDIRILIPAWRARFVRSGFPQAKAFLDFLEHELAACRFPKTLPRGLTHQDIKPENVVFAGGHVSGVLDFDNCYRGILLHDLTTTIIWWGFSGTRLSLPLVEAFLRGYDAERALTADERRLLLCDGLRFRLLREMFIGPMTTLGDIPLAVERAAHFERCYRRLFPTKEPAFLA
jgi:homoserine kinase type II